MKISMILVAFLALGIFCLIVYLVRRSKKVIVQFGENRTIRLDSVDVKIYPDWEKPNQPLYIYGQIEYKVVAEDYGREVQGDRIRTDQLKDIILFPYESTIIEPIISYRAKWVARYRLTIVLMSPHDQNIGSESQLIVWLERL